MCASDGVGMRANRRGSAWKCVVEASKMRCECVANRREGVGMRRNFVVEASVEKSGRL